LSGRSSGKERGDGREKGRELILERRLGWTSYEDSINSKDERCKNNILTSQGKLDNPCTILLLMNGTIPPLSQGGGKDINMGVLAWSILREGI